MIVLLLLLAMMGSAAAHDWYPTECCSEKDCAIISDSQVREVRDGFLIGEEFFPRARSRQSPDENYHICRNPHIICFFYPHRGA